VSSSQTGVRPFFDLYSRGEITAEQIDDFVHQWHHAPESEQRSLAEYLGMTDEEYAVSVMDPAALPQILAAREQGRPLRAVMADYVARLRLGHWLKRQFAERPLDDERRR
jgi:hypothetical protein